MKVGLIFPSVLSHIDAFSKNSFYASSTRRILGLGRSNLIPPLSLLMLAAVTPREHEIRFIDERLESINFDERFDLVGISVVTKSAPRAYQIADEFHRRSIPVVMGGIHPSVLPLEAALHADSVVVGEAEKIWPNLLQDYGNGKPKKFYLREYPINFSELPWPRREIIPDANRYLTTKIISATRGCENSCTFCSNGAATGKKFRVRAIDEIIEEINSIPGGFVHFLDDNIGWDIEFTKNLTAALIPLRIKWIGSTTLPAAEDKELLNLMQKSGCIALDLGFESTSQEVIQAIRKQRTNNIERYREIIENIHAHSITIFGNFILGFDQDDQSVFGQVVRFIEETSIDCPMVNVLIPYPGCNLFRQYERECRLFHKEWDLYDDAAGCVVYQPMNMSAKELMQGFFGVIDKVNNSFSYTKRIIKSGISNPLGIALGYGFNLQKRKNVLSGKVKAMRALESIHPIQNFLVRK